MGTNQLAIRLYNSPDKAPKFKAPEFLGASLEEINVVRRGTIEGNATLDLIFVDAKGQKHIAMITARLMEQVVFLATRGPEETGERDV